MSPNIYVINLERSTHRRLQMNEQLAKLGLAGTFVPAVDGNHLSSDDWSRVDTEARIRLGYSLLTAAEIGCYLSHLYLWKKIADGPEGWALICEDDILIDADLSLILNQIGNLQKPWDCIRLAGLYRAPSVKLRSIGDNRSLNILLNTACGAQAYCLSKHGAQKLLAMANPIVRPVDNLLDRYWESGLIILAIQPYPIRQDEDMPSDIGEARRQQACFEKKNAHAIHLWKRRLAKWRDSFAKRRRNVALLILASEFKK